MPGKMDWLRFERRLREVFDAYVPAARIADVDEESMRNMLVMIASIIGEETGRGYPLNDEPSES